MLKPSQPPVSRERGNKVLSSTIAIPRLASTKLRYDHTPFAGDISKRELMKLFRVLCAFLVLACSFCYGQFTSRLDAVDQRLSLDVHHNILSSTVLIQGTAVNTHLEHISENISRTSYFAQYPYHSQIFYLQDTAVNAFSGGAGRLYVASGLVQTVQSNEGILAFAIGHEMAHNRLRHVAKKYLRRIAFEIAYRNLRVQSPRSALVYKIAWYITEKKIERGEENEADRLGMRAAAEAGYHPDYAILAARVLREQLPDSSKLVTFFSSHPRWITREERTEKGYADALAVFGEILAGYCGNSRRYSASSCDCVTRANR
jgi:hypothetical protein